MMHCTVDSWRQPFPSQTFIENRKRRKSLGEGAGVTSRKAQGMAAKLMLALISAGASCTGSRPGTAGRVLWELGMSGFLIHHCSLLPALHKERFCTWASQYVDLLAWTAHPHALSHPTSLCERSTLAGNSDLLSCRNTHQQCQAQCDHFGWVWFIAVKEHSYSILKNHVML